MQMEVQLVSVYFPQRGTGPGCSSKSKIERFQSHVKRDQGSNL